VSAQIAGVYAALLTPRTPEGALNCEALGALVGLCEQSPVAGVVVNGATGEYCATSEAECEQLVRVCSTVLDGRKTILCGIGSASWSASVALGRLALANGAGGLLLPPPHFFPYSQDDVLSYCGAVASQLPGPVLLYNLPRFTSEIEPSTAQTLLESMSNVVGVKDSSGSLDLLRALAVHPRRDVSRIVGDDRVLVEALTEQICNGAISGVCGVLPELITFLFQNHKCRTSPWYRKSECFLQELVDQLSRFPVPWGLKWIAGCRGLAPAYHAQPLSPHRLRQRAAFQEWFCHWWPAVQALLAAVPQTGGESFR